MKIIATTVFEGSKDDKNTYQLGLERYKSSDPLSTCNNRITLVVYRNFQGDSDTRDIVSGGWFIDHVMGSPSLCIDGRGEWYVYPTKEAWVEIEELVKTM